MPRCVPCNRSFGNTQSLQQHLQDSPQHLQDAPLGSSTSTTCMQCDRTFGTTQSLMQHLESSSFHLQARENTASQQPFSDDEDGHSDEDKPDKKIESDDEDISSFTYPELHHAVLDAVPEIVPSPHFENNLDLPFDEKYSTNVMATFKCRGHGRAPNVWGSKKVAIVIRGYGSNGYNAVVYNQRCHKCEGLGAIYLDETAYVERVAYRLKKWAGLGVDKPFFNQRKGPPHREDLCEGCKAGECQFGQ